MPWDLTWKDFFIAFWPNFVSSVVVGGIIGVLFSWWLAKKIGQELNKKERKLEELIEKNKDIIQRFCSMKDLNKKL